MPKGKRKVSLMLEEAELKKVEDLNRRKKKALEDQAELLRQEREIQDATNVDIDGPGDEGRGTEIVSEQFADVISSLEEDGKFWVYRIDEKGRSSQCGTWPVADWPARMEEIAHEAGGGTFKVQFKRANGQQVRQTTVTFDPKFYGKKEEGKSADAGLFNVLAEMQKNTAAVLESGRRDMMDMMKTIVTVMGNKSGPNYSEIAALGEIFADKGDKSSSSDVLLKGIELGMKMADGREPPSGLDRLIETMGAPAAQILSRLVAAPQVVKRPAPVASPKPLAEIAPPVAAVPAPPPEGDNVPTEDPIRSNPFYIAFVPKVMAAMKAGDDPKEWAEGICDMIPALYHPELLKIVEKPDLVEFLGSYEPEARNHAVWITKVRDEILALFPPEDGVQAAPGVLKMTSMPVDGNGQPKYEVPAAAVQALTE